MSRGATLGVAGGLALLAATLSACQPDWYARSVVVADEPAGWELYSDRSRGYSVRIPPGWQRAAEPVTAMLDDPRELVAAGTFRLRHQQTNCEAFAGAARSDMGPTDVFLIVQERGYEPADDPIDFPPRPERFGPVGDGDPAEPGCGDPPGTEIHWRDFSDAGRDFHSLVAIGPEAPQPLRSEAWQILDSLWLDPGWRPTWANSG